MRISAKPDIHSGEAVQIVLGLSERSDAGVQLEDVLSLSKNLSNVKHCKMMKLSE